jgi:hypothetical protein
MTDELKRVRDWARDEVRSGRVPNVLWYQHIKLIEAADDLLHEMRVATNLADRSRTSDGEGRMEEAYTSPANHH